MYAIRSYYGCAGLDVFVQEPVAIDNPLLKLDNVILSPHNAALTSEAMDRMGVHAATGIDEILRGKKPTWPVNRIVITSYSIHYTKLYEFFGEYWE